MGTAQCAEGDLQRLPGKGRSQTEGPDAEKQHQDALSSDTVAIDFAHPVAPASSGVPTTSALNERDEISSESPAWVTGSVDGGDGRRQSSAQTASEQQPKSDPMSGYDFDGYQGTALPRL